MKATSSPITTAAETALWFLCRAKSEDRPRLISNKKLQKLIYYAQAWHLVEADGPLFGDPIEAWVHGPVVADVYHQYKVFGFNPIAVEDAACPAYPEESRVVLEDVWRVYGGLDANYLERLTHSEPPWQIARENLEFNQNSNAVISLDDMRNYYSSIQDEGEGNGAAEG